MEIPEGYSEAEWNDYQTGPVRFCIKELTNPDPSVRFNAADILREIASDAEAAIPALTAALRDENINVRAQCAFALTDIGYALRGLPAETVTCLGDSLADSDAEVWAFAAHALSVANEVPDRISQTYAG
jgi:HEAT repeat protein